MFNILCHHRNANQNDLGSTLHPSEWVRLKTKWTAHAGKDVELGDHLAGESTNLNNHSGNQFGNFLEHLEYFYLKTQLHHSWTLTKHLTRPSPSQRREGSDGERKYVRGTGRRRE